MLALVRHFPLCIPIHRHTVQCELDLEQKESTGQTYICPLPTFINLNSLQPLPHPHAVRCWAQFWTFQVPRSGVTSYVRVHSKENTKVCSGRGGIRQTLFSVRRVAATREIARGHSSILSTPGMTTTSRQVRLRNRTRNARLTTGVVAVHNSRWRHHATLMF